MDLEETRKGSEPWQAILDNATMMSRRVSRSADEREADTEGVSPAASMKKGFAR